MSDQMNPGNAGAPQRPTFLTVLCILSWIAQGLGIVFLLMATLFAGAVTAGVAGMEDAGAVVSGSGMGNVWLYLGLGVIMVVAGFIGVIKMWKLQKQGFFIYAGASVAGIIVDIALSGAGFNITSVIVTAAFIAMYGVNLKHMR